MSLVSNCSRSPGMDSIASLYILSKLPGCSLLVRGVLFLWPSFCPFYRYTLQIPFSSSRVSYRIFRKRGGGGGGGGGGII